MAIDEQLLTDAQRGIATLRLYRWTPPTLSFGRNEPIAALYDFAEIERRGIATVRRPTGGKAVWHDDEVTYAVAAPIGLFGSLRSAYRAIHTRLAAALSTLGLDAVLASDHPPIRPSANPAACFSAPVGGEILVRGKKLVGSAQVRRGTAFLQHGSILLGGSQALVRAVSRQPAGPSAEATVGAELGRAVSFDEVGAAILAHWTLRHLACVTPE